MDLKVTRYEVDDAGVATVWLHRPERRNSWTGRMHDEYRWICAQLEADPAARVIVVRGSGDTFSVGADMRAMDRHIEKGYYDTGLPEDTARPGHGVRPELDADMAWQLGLRLPMIAAVNGACAGIALALAAFCDLRFAVEGAKVTTATARLALPAEYGLSWMLPRLLGMTHAADLLLTGRVVLAEEFGAMGFFNAVLPAGSFDDHVAGYARLLAELSPEAVATTKRQLWDDLLHADPRASVEESKVHLDRLMKLPDYAEGVAAFQEKSLPASGRSVSAVEPRTDVSELFDPAAWVEVPDFKFTDITYHRGTEVPAVRIAFDRPEVRNAFRPHTVDELYQALDHARMNPDVGCVLLTGNGPSPKDGGWAFCSGGDQRIRGRTGYQYASGETAETVDPARAGRLHILECQRLIRFMPKFVICVVPGWAAGGGHSLHVVSDMTLASAEHARFKQTDADVGSFDGGFGSAYLARQVGQKFAREIFALGREYTAEDMHRMGAVNAVVPHAELEATALQWASEICAKSPTAQRMLKYAFNLIDDGLVGQQLFAGEATRLAYMADEAVEGRDAFLEKRPPDLKQFPYYY